MILKLAIVIAIAAAAGIWLAGVAVACADTSTVTTQDVGTVVALAPTAAPTPTPTAVACPFYKGWNLTVLNGTPALLPACVSVVFEWDQDYESWHFWGRDNLPVFNDLSAFTWGRAYWAYVP